MKNLFYFILILFCACATVSSPTGGPKDLSPPKVLSTYPDSAQTNFKGKTITIKLDEYFVLNNINSQLIVSPPLNELPDIRTSKQKIIIQLKEDLKENTTYVFNFGNSIKDLNEGNVLKNYQLVFSTGNSIDSFSQSGNVVNAESLEPEPDVKVYLFKELSDSNLLINKPYYVTRTDENGEFQFKHITNDTFKIYALKDINNNNKLEKDELLAFYPKTFTLDSNRVKLLLASNSNTDSLKIINQSFTKKGVFITKFNQNIESYIDKIQINTNLTSSNKKDNPITIISNDTLYYYPKFSLDNIDSVDLNILIDQESFKNKIAIKKARIEKVKLKVSSKIPPVKRLIITSNNPIVKYNSLHVKLINLKDSTDVQIQTIKKRDYFHLELFANFKEETDYQLIFNSNSIYDYSNQNIESDTFLFKTYSNTNTGNLNLDVEIDDSTNTDEYIVQLFKGKTLIKETRINNSTTLEYLYLLPGKYQAKAFRDKNKSGKWDNHNLLENKLAEEFYILDKNIEVRANWDLKDIKLIIK